MVNAFLSILLLCLSFTLHSQGKIIYEIFDKICASLQVEKSKKPNLIVKNTASSGASYSKLNHTIYIDQKLIDAFSSLKRQQYLALAFVLGHELSHALEKDKHDTHFLAYDKSQDATYQNEQNADIQGAFVAYISGYNVLPTITETIETLYSQYHLNAQLNGYPSKTDRIESIGLVKEQVESLIALFKSANLLLLTGDYNLSATIYERLAQYYPSAEVNSNIAVAQLLEALNLGKYNYFKYSLPFEINWEVRLNKSGLDPGQKDFEPDIIRRRELLLKKTDILLKQSLDYYPNSFALWNNLICLKLILNESETANQFLQIANTKFKLKEQLEQLQVLRGINALLQGKSNEAMKYFKGIQSPWLNKIIEQNSSPSKLMHMENNCMPDIILPQSKDKGTLLQEKKINMDTISMNWNREQITITTPSKNKVFKLVHILSPIKCIPIKVFDQRGVRWNYSLISIKNPLDDKLVFYSVR